MNVWVCLNRASLSSGHSLRLTTEFQIPKQDPAECFLRGIARRAQYFKEAQ